MTCLEDDHECMVYVSHSYLGKTAVNRVRVSGSVPHTPSLYGVIRWVLEFSVRAG